MAQHVILALKPHPLEAARDGVQDLVGAERLQDEIDGAGLQRLDRGFEIGVGGDQNRVGEKADRALFREPFDAMSARHDVVENDDVEILASSFRDASSVSAASSMRLQRDPMVRTRKLRMPGSSSTTRIDACASHGPNSGSPSFS